MKRVNLYLISAALLTGFLTSCNDMENFDNNVFVDNTIKVNSIFLKGSNDSEQRSFKVAIAKQESEDVTIHIAADPSLVSTYNEGYYDQTIALPTNCYKIPEPEVVIPAGSVQSSEITIVFENLLSLDRDQKYVLPVTVDNANIGILQSARTIYYVFKGAALINTVANMTKNCVYFKWKNPEPLNNLRKVSMEALIRPHEFRALNTVMGIEGSFLLRIGDVGIEPNRLQAPGIDGKSVKGPLIEADVWTHLAVTYDADAKTCIVYVNGEEFVRNENTQAGIEGDGGTVHIGAPFADTPEQSPYSFRIGYSYNDDRYLCGEISECRIWNKVLTPEQINEKDHFYAVDPSSEGLIAFLKFDEGVVGAIKDYTQNGNDGTALTDLEWVEVELGK